MLKRIHMEPTPLPPNTGNPFQPPAPPLAGDVIGDARVGSPFAAPSGFGNQISRAFNCYLAQ